MGRLPIGRPIASDCGFFRRKGLAIYLADATFDGLGGLTGRGFQMPAMNEATSTLGAIQKAAMVEVVARDMVSHVGSCGDEAQARELVDKVLGLLTETNPNMATQLMVLASMMATVAHAVVPHEPLTDMDCAIRLRAMVLMASQCTADHPGTAH